MSKDNLIKTLITHSIKILKKDGLKGYFSSIREYYESYPPFRKLVYYWLYSKLHKNKMIIREIQGSKMYLNLDDFGLSKQLFLNGIREPECTRIMKKYLKKDMIIAEIGANIGYYALMEASIIGKNGTIYAIEPFPPNYELLKKNIDINSYNDRIETYNLAISNVPGKTKLFIKEKHNLCNMLETENEESFVEIDTTTLDDFIKGKKIPDMIRMDIEGYEFYVVEGMKETLEKCKKCTLFIEIHPYQMYQKDLDYKKPIKLLFDKDFKPAYIIKEHGPLKEESFRYTGKINAFFDFLEQKKLVPPDNTHGFGLFLEKNKK
jgi:FkbM family methyltransferase